MICVVYTKKGLTNLEKCDIICAGGEIIIICGMSLNIINLTIT